MQIFIVHRMTTVNTVLSLQFCLFVLVSISHSWTTRRRLKMQNCDIGCTV